MKYLPIFCALIFSSAAESATRYVDPSHPQSKNSGAGAATVPYKTISHAMRQLVSGDRLVIAAGTYRETMNPKVGASNLVMEGSPGTMIKGPDIVTGWVSAGGGRFVRRNWTVNSQQVFVNGVSRGIYLATASNALIAHNLVVNNGWEGIIVHNDRRATTSYLPDALPRNNQVIGNISGWNGGKCLFMGDRAYNNKANGNLYVGSQLCNFGLERGLTYASATGLPQWNSVSAQDKNSWEKITSLGAVSVSTLSAQQANVSWSSLKSLASQYRSPPTPLDSGLPPGPVSYSLAGGVITAATTHSPSTDPASQTASAPTSTSSSANTGTTPLAPAPTAAPTPAPAPAPAPVAAAPAPTPAPAPAPALNAVNVKDFGAVGNGATNDSSSIKNALAAAFKTSSKAVQFPAGNYYLGEHSAADVIFDLSSYGDNLTLISDSARFVINSTGQGNSPIIFRMMGQNNIKFQGDWYFEDLGGNNFSPVYNSSNPRAATALAVGANSSFITIDKLHTLNMQSGFTGFENGAPGTSHTITITEIHAKGTSKPFRLQNQGNNVKVGIIYAENCMRPFFVYGVDGVEATVIAKNNTDGFMSMIKRYGWNTRNVKLTISDTRTYGKRQPLLNIQQDNADGVAAIIENIDVQISWAFSDANLNYGGEDYGIVDLHSLVNESLVTSSNQIWRNIKINGASGPSYPWLVRATFTSLNPKGSLVLPANEPMYPGLTALFNVSPLP